MSTKCNDYIVIEDIIFYCEKEEKHKVHVFKGKSIDSDYDISTNLDATGLYEVTVKWRVTNE